MGWCGERLIGAFCPRTLLVRPLPQLVKSLRQKIYIIYQGTWYAQENGGMRME